MVTVICHFRTTSLLYYILCLKAIKECSYADYVLSWYLDADSFGWQKWAESIQVHRNHLF